MIAVLQRVKSGKVVVEGATVGSIERGFVVLLGVARGDGKKEADYLARRVAELRVFEDGHGRMNRALAEDGGAVLVVPQFTLLAGLKDGRRPDFVDAAEPVVARALFERLVAELRARGLPVSTGAFGAQMLVEIHNDGPATFILDTRELMKSGSGVAGQPE